MTEETEGARGDLEEVVGEDLHDLTEGAAAAAVEETRGAAEDSDEAIDREDSKVKFKKT